MGGLALYNTRARRKERFEPLEPGHVRMYTCGPTVYGVQHIGNLRSQLAADLLKRVFLSEGYRVSHVINVTDVGHLTSNADVGDDKIERAAAEAGRTAAEIAERYTALWLRDREQVGCLPPEVLCRATEHIADQIALAQRLEEKGYTYRLDDGIYFDTSKFPRYAELGRLDLEGQAGGARIADVPGKRNPADFALWKFPAPGVVRQQEWDSPWGRGFPGWHLECSAMSSRYLGRTFDVHTGGADLIRVHHTNEVAQSEGAYDVHPWVRFWLHNEFLDFRGEKMSKSTGNIWALEDLVAAGCPPLAYRYFFLQAHYRQQQTFTEEAIEAAATGYDRLLGLAAELRQAAGDAEEAALEPARQRFRQAIHDDLNAPRALAVAWEIARDDALPAAGRWALLRDFDAVLCLDLAEALPRARQQQSDPRIDALVAQREDARRRRDFAESDRIRAALRDQGILVEDTPDGPRWRRR